MCHLIEELDGKDVRNFQLNFVLSLVTTDTADGDIKEYSLNW